MKSIVRTAFLVGFVLFSLSYAQTKADRLKTARAAVEASMKTPAGKAYQDKLGETFQKQYSPAMGACIKAAGGYAGSFEVFLLLSKTGKVKEGLANPEDKVPVCLRDALVKGTFPAPPQDAYWGLIPMTVRK